MISYHNILFEYKFYILLHIITAGKHFMEIRGDVMSKTEMTRIEKNVYQIPEDVFKDEVFKKLVHTKAFSWLRCLGPECLSDEERKKIAKQFAEYCKVAIPKEE